MTSQAAQSGSFEAKAHGLVYPFDTPPPFGETHAITEDVLWLRMPLPFALNHINLWLLKDKDKWIIVDTGLNIKETRDLWKKTLHDSQGNPFDIKEIIVTHMHPDHIGCAGWLAQLFKVPLSMSRTDYLMCRSLVADTGNRAPEEALSFYRAAGFDAQALEVYQERFGGFGRYIAPLPNAFKRLKDGDTCTINDKQWHVVVGSGHTPEHLCLYCPQSKIMLSGDQVLPRISSNVSLFPTEPEANPLQDWLDSCARLQKKIPDDVLVLPAHNTPFYGLHERLKALIDGHERGLARLLKTCQKPHRSVDVFSTLFKRPITNDTRIMATGESLAHLRCLVHREKMRVTRDDHGVDWYQSL